MSYIRRRYRPRSYSHRGSIRQRRKNWKPLIIFIVSLLLLFWIGYKLVKLFSGNKLSQSAEAKIEVLQGVADFSLSENKENIWTRAATNQILLQGDKLKTSGNGITRVDIAGLSNLFLAPSTEIEFKKLNKKQNGDNKIEISLKEGELWVRVLEDQFSTSDSYFVVNTPMAKTYARGTIFDISASSKSEIVRLLKGSVDADIYGETEKEIENIAVGVGQKIIIDEYSYKKAKSGDNLLEINDNEFIQSEWNLKNLEQFDSQGAAKIREEIQKSSQKIESNSANENVDLEIESPIILNPDNGAVVSASEDIVTITGTVPENIFQVSVNGYTLTKFQPGDRKWSYFASRKFGTMVPGENKYSVVAIRRDGKESAPSEVTFTYEGQAIQNETEEKAKEVVDTGVTVVEDNFKSPEILKPVRINPDEPYQTSSEVVTISGIVDPRTTKVVVNGFQLREFKTGKTDFRYIANARYGNMKKGENVYEVTCYGPNGQTKSASIKIVYTPIQL